ncbi:MAG: DUF177 domain-containing protein [Alphaproteobacteria bacterium]
MSELDRWVSVADIGQGGLRQRIEASPGELAALARRYGVPAVVSLVAEVALRPVGRSRYRLTGRVEAVMRQVCVVSLDEIENRVTEDFAVDFEPQAGKPQSNEIDIDVEADDPPEPIVDGRIPVGEMVAEHLALAIDPYPRRPDAVLEDDPSEPAPARQSPFAILRKLS